MPRLIIISNRLPITIDKKEGELIYFPSAGGLATGLNSLDDNIEKLWVGWPGKQIDDLWEQDAVRKDLAKQHLVPVFLSQKEIRLYYEGFSNKTVWPHFHYFTQYTTYSESFWKAYQRTNQHFAEVVIEQIREDDIVWVHDYQLMLLPALIREAFPNLSIGFFLHIPFPSYEIFRLLPWREPILEGILGADLIGFHTFGYMRHFLSAVYRIAGFEHQFGSLMIGHRNVHVDVYPMGIDYYKYANPEIDILKTDDSFKIKQLAKGRRLIISIDRLDYTKGIPQRIKAFERFIINYPEYRGKVSLVLIVVPSRSNVDQYQDLKHQVDTLVGQVNGQFGAFDWIPIKYFYRSLDFAELTTLYQVADVAMITPLRDGMNLVAKEYIASKEKSKSGVLILSEMAGASIELTEAIPVNPQDIQNMAQALYMALSMNPKEQAWRLETMQKKLQKYDVSHWANTFINEQIELMEKQKNKNIRYLESGSKRELIEAYQSAGSRLIILDYDGTLMHFHPNPQAVSPDQPLFQILDGLIRQNGNHLVINSGRDRQTLQKWLGELKVDLAAEHGGWTKIKGQWSKNPGLSSSWKTEVRAVLENMVERTPGSFIEDKEYSIAWHYRRVDKDFGEKRVREFRDVLLYLTANLDLQVLEGNKVVEIKNAGVNKGKASLNWVNAKPWDFIMAIGDDHTDEDTFKALPENAFTIKVGKDSSAARFHLISVDEVRTLLTELSSIE